MCSVSPTLASRLCRVSCDVMVMSLELWDCCEVFTESGHLLGSEVTEAPPTCCDQSDSSWDPEMEEDHIENTGTHSQSKARFKVQEHRIVRGCEDITHFLLCGQQGNATYCEMQRKRCLTERQSMSNSWTVCQLKASVYFQDTQQNRTHEVSTQYRWWVCWV